MNAQYVDNNGFQSPQWGDNSKVGDKEKKAPRIDEVSVPAMGR